MRLLLVDRSVLLVLAVLPAFLLVPVYGSAAPVWVWAAGALLSTLLVTGVALLRWPWWSAVPLTAVVVLLVGPLLTGGDVGPAASVGLARAAVTGWRDMLTVATPIGTSGDLLAPALFAGAAVALASQLLVTTRHWGLALLPVALGSLLAALLGPAGGVRWAALALLAGDVLLGIGWAAWRRRRGARQIRPEGTRWRRPVAAGVVLAAGVVAGVALLPADQDDRLALRSELAVPIDLRSFPSPLSDFRRLVGDDASVVQLTVTGAVPGDRLRLAALDAYDGQTFTATADEGPFARIGATRPAAQAGSERTIGVTADGWTGPWLPTLGELTSVEFGTDELTTAFRYSGPALTGLLPDGLPTGTGWRQSGVAGDGSTATGTDRLAGTSWPQTAPIPDALRVAAAKYAAGATGPADQLAAIAAGLSSTGYFSHGEPGQLRSPSGHGMNRLLAMVDGSGMVGDAEQYAALMAVLARAIGVPARVVVGFEVPDGGAGASAGAVELTGADLTAWVEVQFQQAGWVAFDPTPPESRNTLETEPQTDAGRHIPDNQPPPAAAGADAAQVQAGDSQHDNLSDTSDADDGLGAAGLPWWFWAGAALTAFGLLLMLPVLLILGVKSFRRRRRQTAPSPNARIRGAWREVLDRGLDAGFAPPAGGTRREISDELWRATAVDTRPLARAADQAQFAGVALAPAAADAGWVAARSQSDALLAGLGFSARWRARLSLSSLRRRV